MGKMQAYAELVERTAALRDLKLLVWSRCLEFEKRTAGMDVLNKHVDQIFLPQCVTFREHGQLKGWQPTSNPQGLTTQSQQLFVGCSSLIPGTTESTITVL